jgi:hypothetical protein
MNVTVRQPTIVLVTALVILAPAAAAYARGEAGHPPQPKAPSLRGRIDLYSPRVRRSTITYLRLRLLELREEGLERARAAIERRLSIDELLAEPAPHDFDEVRAGLRGSQPPVTEKAKSTQSRNPGRNP